MARILLCITVHASFAVRGAHGPCRDTGLVSLTIKPILKGEIP